MSTLYTRPYLRAILNRGIHNKLGVLPDPNATINDAVREVTALMDLRSMKRSSALSPVLSSTNNIYTWPSDVKGSKIIGIQPVGVDRLPGEGWHLLYAEDFDQYKYQGYNLISFKDIDDVRSLLISTTLNADGTIVHNLLYYTRYPWLAANGTTRKAEATLDTDYLACDEDEFSLFREKVIEIGAPEARETEDANRALIKFGELKKNYERSYKSEALRLEQDYYVI